MPDVSFPFADIQRIGPLFIPQQCTDTKDPCPVFDGQQWHIYGSGGDSRSEHWVILHATAPAITGPWTEESPVILNGVQGPHVAAPAVIFDPEESVFHMFIQTDFMALDTRVVHLISRDGKIFDRKDTALESIPMTTEAGIYDPHAAVGPEGKYLTYSGCTVVSRPDIYLAKSRTNTWNGPWRRIGRILEHEHVPHHNQHGHQDYEWGLEGSQLIVLPSGFYLLIAVCFLPDARRGQRQRVFFAASKKIKGPYRTLGPVLHPDSERDWESGENGHAAGVIVDDSLYLFYQARSANEVERPWRYGIAVFPLEVLQSAVSRVLETKRSVKV
jgi:hypothetical protein